MAEEKEKSAIERLKESLYRRIPPEADKRSGFSEQEFSVPHEWGDSPAAPDVGSLARERPSFSDFFTMKKIFIAALVFFGIGLVFFLFVILRGANVVSSRNIAILVDGPVSVKAGEEVSFTIAIENKNNVALEFSDLLIEFPQGTRVGKSLEEELARFRKSLGTIPARDTVEETVDAVFFGQEGDDKEIAITLEYRAQGSNAIFVADKKYQVHVSESPFVVVASAPEEVSAKQEFVFTVELSSKTEETVEDVLVFIDYPFGFSFVGASPEPSFGNDTWSLGDLPRGGKRTVTVRGVLEGQDEDEKIFRVQSGLAKSPENGTLGVTYGMVLKAVRIIRPSLGVRPSLRNSTAADVAVPAGERTDGNIRLTNNTLTKITDVRIAVKLTGDILDKASVMAPEGFYRSLDSTILWDQNSLAKLGEIPPGESVSLSFSFTPRSSLGGSARIKNPVVALEVRADGKHLGSDGVLKDVHIEESQMAKVTSDIDLTARAVYHEGPFANSGSIPPKVEQETTYTVFLALVNTANDVRDVRVEARLPAYVRWVGAVSPASEDVSYNGDTRRVSWRAGDLVAWKGVSSAPREVAFQIGFLPSLSQVGATHTLIEGSTLTGADEFTDAPLEDTASSVSTDITTDSQFKSGDGTVGQ